MFKIAVSLITITFILCMTSFFWGMNHAPKEIPASDVDNVQHICNLARKEPWKKEIQTSCDFLQEWWNISYKCNDIQGCVAAYGKNNN